MRIVVGLAVRRPGCSSWRGWPCSSWPTPAAGLAHPPPPNSSFLPTDVESQRAAALEAARFGGGHQVAELVVVDQQGLQRHRGGSEPGPRSEGRGIREAGPPAGHL